HSRTETGSLRTGGLQQYCPVEARKPAEQPKACLLRPPTPDMLGSSQSKLLDRSHAARPPLERGAHAHLLELYSRPSEQLARANFYAKIEARPVTSPPCSFVDYTSHSV